MHFMELSFMVAGTTDNDNAEMLSASDTTSVVASGMYNWDD